MTTIRLFNILLNPIVILGGLAVFYSTSIFAQPANDLCANAIAITSSTGACNSTAGTISGATYTAIGSACGTSRPDVWYKFTAQSTLPTITVTGLANPQIQVYTLASCGGTVTSMGCIASGSGVPTTALTIGSQYLVRVYQSTTATPYAFNICISDPAANDLCANATTISTSMCNGTGGSLYGASYTAPGAGSFCAGTTNKFDVWYNFTASGTADTITIDGAPPNTIYQVYTAGSCAGSMTSVSCGTSYTGIVTGLTNGTNYLLRVYNSSNTRGTFSVSVKDTSGNSNDFFSNARTLTPASACVSTAGNFFKTCAGTAPPITNDCAGTVNFDMWYKFVAPAEYATVTMGSVGSAITNYGVEILAGDYNGLNAIACGTNSASVSSGLIPGNTYYVRVYSGGAIPTSSTNAGFNICVTVPPPVNDNCAGAINLSVNGTCSKTFGTVSMSTLSTGITTGSCSGSGTAAFDVWYKFTATNATPTINMADFGAAFVATRRMELYSGACGSLTAMNQCGTSSINATGLTVGTTYYIRVYSTTAYTIGDGKFSLCITSASAASPVRIGNSYVNVTRNTTGGVVQPGDILEIRMTVLVGSGTIYKTRYLDSIPSNTTMDIPSGIQIITNEGLTYKTYSATDGLNDDAATYKSSGAGEYNIRVNLGLTAGNWATAPADNGTASTTGAGNIPANVVPKGGGGTMFATSFRVQVTGSVGDTIVLNGGKFIYEATNGGADIPLSGTPYQILISDPLTLCSNSVGINNANEFNGTFGSGNTLNRSTDLTTPIAGYTFVQESSAQYVGDGQYALVNNSSPLGGINENAYFTTNSVSPSAPDMNKANRMFGGYWYIDGDHTGTNSAAGNSPAAPGNTGGYMLAVNADYVASEAYRQTLNGLCPNTYYEFSAWFKNICPICGIDSTGAQFAGTATAPTAGYVGVYPNLSFALDGLDRYSTGQIDVGGENGGWVKKGFVFKTDTAQTTATLSIRNNAQGGGGNDWVMDDISIATCFPSMSYSPTATPSVCAGNTIQIGDTVRSQFSNYTYYVWQRSQDGGTTWTDLTTPQTASPGLVGSQYQYITTLNLPAANTTLADSGDIYRVYTATTIPNIVNPNCVANDGSAPISLSVLNCGIALKTDLLSFNGNLMNNYSVLSWSTSKEEKAVHFELQRSDDNLQFNTIAIINGKNNGQQANYYSFTDPQLVTTKKWYRLIMIFDNGNMKYSHAIQLNIIPVDFELENIINPFSSQLLLNVITSKSSKVDIELIDMQGKNVKSSSYLVYAGSNSLRISNTDALAPGIYTLRVKNNDKVISKKVMKNNN